MIAILLCAGFGTRMYPLTRNHPKPLLHVAGRPVLDYLVDQLVRFPLMEAIHVVSNGSFYTRFAQWRDGWQSWLGKAGLRIHLHDDGVTRSEDRLGMAGDLGFVLDTVGIPDGAVVAAGDNIFRFDLLPLWERFRAGRISYLLALRETDPAELARTAVLELGQGDRVLKVHDRPERPPSKWTSPAFYFLRCGALRRVHEFRLQTEHRHMVGYLVEKEPIHALKVRGSRFHIGTLDVYEEANRILAREPVILQMGESAG